MTHTRWLPLIVIQVLILGLFACTKSDEGEKTKASVKVVYGSVPVSIEAPAHIAYHNKYFEEEGLDVELRINPDGKTSLEQLFEGRADIIAVTGTPVVYADFNRNDFYIIGDIKHSNIHFCLARKDKGINTIADLKGKKIGVMKGTSADFFMDLFFAYNHITRSEVKIVEMNAPTMVKSIENGHIDAMFCWQPWVLKAKKALGSNGLILPNEHIHIGSWVIIAMKQFADQHPEIMEKFVKAIVKAETFIKNNPEKSIEIHAKVSGVNQDIAAALFDNIGQGISLDQGLLDILEDQARWAIRYGYTDQKKVPNYLDLIYFKALECVKPEAVTIIK